MESIRELINEQQVVGSINDIPEIFINGIFPSTYINNVIGWGVSEDELHEKLPDGTYRLVTMDIDFGVKCSLRCPHCFQSNQLPYKFKKQLSWQETISIIDQAKELGLKYVKILGAGEPFENTKFLDFLIELDKRDIHTAIFTKGHVIGSDNLVKQYFGERGINTSEELVEVLYKLKTSILLGFNSFDEEIQNTSVGVGKRHQLSNYVELRDRALLLLTEKGFNNFHPNTPTRLSLVVAPFKPENVDGVLDIYKWGNLRNIYVAACPTTSSGNGHKELSREERKDFNTYITNVKQTYIDIYKWALVTGAIRKGDFVKHGVSLYPGGHPCNQVAGGFYIKLDGTAYICPGNDTEKFFISNDVVNTPLKEIWVNSPNYKLAAQNKFNFGCLARSNSFFAGYPNFYNDVLEKVLKDAL
jgi:MoaA/NifB/PqqE/SkfB family radical SAM enzyme